MGKGIKTSSEVQPLLRAFKIKEGIPHYHLDKVARCQICKGQSLPDAFPSLLLEQYKSNCRPTSPTACLWPAVKAAQADLWGPQGWRPCVLRWAVTTSGSITRPRLDGHDQIAAMPRRRVVLFPGEMQNDVFTWGWSIFRFIARWGYTTFN